jgi:hypothetical protein
VKTEQFTTWAGALGNCIRELESFGYKVTDFEYMPNPPEHYESYPYGWLVTVTGGRVPSVTNGMVDLLVVLNEELAEDEIGKGMLALKNDEGKDDDDESKSSSVRYVPCPCGCPAWQIEVA